MKWDELNKSNPIVKSIKDDWCKLLLEKRKEQEYHDYLKTHASFFLYDDMEDPFFAISKLKLGSDFETDFVIPKENYSMGITWHLIEIKTPNAAPFNKNGTPSATLSKATQQIMDWKSWLRKHNSMVSKTFLTNNVSLDEEVNFKFTIYIGTRENSKQHLDKRNTYSKEFGIEIRSFDYLTDKLKNRYFKNKISLYHGSWDERHEDERIKLANPFNEALTDSMWKKILSETYATERHFTATAHLTLLKYMNINTKRSNEFKLWRSEKYNN